MFIVYCLIIVSTLSAVAYAEDSKSCSEYRDQYAEAKCGPDKFEKVVIRESSPDTRYVVGKKKNRFFF